MAASVLTLPPAWALGGLALWAVVLLIAPPESNRVWAVNGFRSINGAARLGLVLAAAALAGVARARGARAPTWAAIGSLLAWSLAFPLREKIHLLGDTALRIHAIHAFSERAARVTVGEIFGGLHATPLDVSVNFIVPIALNRAGLSLLHSISLVSLGLAAIFFTGVWRLTRRLTPHGGIRVPLALALVLTGALEAFAGYAESTALLLALAPWWWSELLAPLPGSRQAMRTTLAWLVLILAHRMALVLLLPMLWRAWGPALHGDRPAGRRALAIAAGATVLLALAALKWSVGATQMGTDVADAFSLLRGERGIGLLSFLDIANLLALVAPLTFLAPLLAGAGACRAWLRTPEARLMLVAAIPLVPLAIVLPAGPHGFGAQRDWDLASLCGWTLTLAAVSLAATGTPGRARGTLLLAIPVLALGAGGWIAANADEMASVRRGQALVTRPPLPAPPHLGAIHQNLGQRAMDLRQFGAAGPHFEQAYEFSPNPRFLLLAAEARLMEGDLRAARADMARARASQGLNVRGLESARQLDAMIEAAEHESTTASPPAAPPR